MPERSPDPLRAALVWLATDPDSDSESELAELHHHVTTLSETSLSLPQRLDALDLLCQRALEVSGRFRPALLLSKLPCSRSRFEQTSTLIDVLFVLSEFARLLLTNRHRWRWSKMTAQVRPIELGLEVLGEANLLSALIGVSTPSGLWHRAHELWLAADQYEQLKDDSIVVMNPSQVGKRYQRLLLMAVSQTETLTAREQQWLFDYLELVAEELTLSLEPLQPEHLVYWFDPAVDTGPVACTLRMPEKGRSVVYFSPAGLARRLGAQILWLEEGLLNAEEFSEANDSGLLDTESSGLPVGLSPVEVLALLRRLKVRWAEVATRTEARSHQHYEVEVCTGIRSVWAAGHGEFTAVDKWTVYNESPGGYAILSVGGVRRSLSPGMVLALRRDASEDWSVCTVRWLHSNGPDQVELGVQRVARNFSSASICFSGGDAMVPALLLHAEPQVRQSPALITSVGTYVSNNFIMVREDERLYVAHGRALGLEMQTASIELLQYEIDYYPKSKRTE
ncbi:hypothetical protein AGMMS49543_05390 [Betaproteobacteria bacterium]|nr:hypothetical protein AGMMS49543_05390 [Betaproteobacteria bacterium]GHU12951.1 hypothetical protein AGMMS50225_21990 [Betaproteobacteria bacterium]GHU23600.1 hypothetical protein AGMMS50243_25300 [Betaproteobacteria bacterium]